MIHDGVRIISDITAICLFKETALKEGGGWEGRAAMVVAVLKCCLKTEQPWQDCILIE